MDPFVRKLVLRLFDEGTPLSRNRHFQTFETPEGKLAMRLSKRLRALQKDITACRDAGGTPQVTRSERGGDVTVQIVLEHLKSRRTTRLDEAEFDLLKGLPGMTGILASN
jgi:hypothetical protein